MQEKINSKTYLLIFAVSFIGFIMAFFLGLWVGGKSSPKHSVNSDVVSVSEEEFSQDYEEVEKNRDFGNNFETKNSKTNSFSSQKTEKSNTVEKNSAKSDAKKIDKKNNKKSSKKSVGVKKNSAKKENSQAKGKEKKKAVVKKTNNQKVTRKKDGEIRYMLQIGAFNKLSEAKRLKLKFEKKGYSVFIVKESRNKTNLYKVRIGTFYSKRIALKVKKKIAREDKIKAWLVPIK